MREYTLQVSDVAQKLGMTPDAVRRAAAAGKLPGVRVGSHGMWRFSAEDVEATLHARQPVEAEPAAQG
jgi:excisionase family DNA binding protein